MVNLINFRKSRNDYLQTLFPAKAKKQVKKTLLLVLILFNPVGVFGQSSKENNICFSNNPSLHYNYEKGVASIFSIQDIVRLKYSEKYLFSFAWRFHLNQQVGLGSFYLAVEEWHTNKTWLLFGGEYEHHEYPAYNIGENQVAIISYFKPWEKLRLGAGFTYKAVDLKDRKVHSPVKWSKEMDEIYLIFQIKWDVVKSDKWELTSKLGTYDFMRIQTKDHLFIEIEQKYAWKENINLHLDISTALKGVSGLILAVNEFRIETGVSFQF
jgi:hypothetical protein